MSPKMLRRCLLNFIGHAINLLCQSFQSCLFLSMSVLQTRFQPTSLYILGGNHLQHFGGGNPPGSGTGCNLTFILAAINDTKVAQSWLDWDCYWDDWDHHCDNNNIAMKWIIWIGWQCPTWSVSTWFPQSSISGPKKQQSQASIAVPRSLAFARSPWPGVFFSALRISSMNSTDSKRSKAPLSDRLLGRAHVGKALKNHQIFLCFFVMASDDPEFRTHSGSTGDTPGDRLEIHPFWRCQRCQWALKMAPSRCTPLWKTHIWSS